VKGTEEIEGSIRLEKEQQKMIKRLGSAVRDGALFIINNHVKL